MDYDKFFSRNSEEVAVDLLGRMLLRNTKIGSTSGRIIETGVYVGGKETKSREGMKYTPGKIFLMPYRGSSLLNISTDREGFASCVEIRGIAFHSGVINGAGKVARFFDITEDLDSIMLGEELQIIGDAVDKSEVRKAKGDSSNCVGFCYIK